MIPCISLSWLTRCRKAWTPFRWTERISQEVVIRSRAPEKSELVRSCWIVGCVSCNVDIRDSFSRHFSRFSCLRLRWQSFRDGCKKGL